MKNFPSLLAVIGAWLCASGFILPGIVAFLFSSLWAIFVDGESSFYTALFFGANIFGFLRLLNAAI